MTHRHNKTYYPVSPSKSKQWKADHGHAMDDVPALPARPKLEIVLKCDSAGSLEAVAVPLLTAALPQVDVSIIYSGVGNIHSSDILMAETASRFIAGFQVDVLPGVDRELREHGVEARLYDVIYKMTEDIRHIAESMAPQPEPGETILGSARVIALFKSSRKGIIIGCEVLDGYLAEGRRFRIISAMGPVFSGAIESIHIENRAVQKAVKGQRAGIKISDFNKARVGDVVESFLPAGVRKHPVWHPRGGVFRV